MDPHEQSDRDFSRARRRAFLRRIGAYLRRDPASNQLLSFDEVKGALGAISQVYLGLREVPVSKIVGSVGRHRDFDRAFLPDRKSTRLNSSHTEIYTLSLHDALPICSWGHLAGLPGAARGASLQDRR